MQQPVFLDTHAGAAGVEPTRRPAEPDSTDMPPERSFYCRGAGVRVQKDRLLHPASLASRARSRRRRATAPTVLNNYG